MPITEPPGATSLDNSVRTDLAPIVAAHRAGPFLAGDTLAQIASLHAAV